jgi:hypothetical protein
MPLGLFQYATFERQHGTADEARCQYQQLQAMQVPPGLLKSVGFRFCRPLQELEKTGHVAKWQEVKP